jgi:hypothetical protein
VDGGVHLGPLGTSATNWPIVPTPDDYDGWQVKPKYSEKTYPSATSSTTNLHVLCLGANPACRGGKPTTNRLSYGTATASVTLAGDVVPRHLVLRGCQHNVRFLCRTLYFSVLLFIHTILLPLLITGHLHLLRLHSHIFFLISAVGLWVLRPLLAYCTSPG